MRAAQEKTQVLICVAYYLPGYKSGGPVQSVKGLCDTFRDAGFRIVAYDRDVGDLDPYPEAQSGSWTTVGDVQVFFVPQSIGRWLAMFDIMRFERGDLVYLQSLFNPCFTLWPLLLRRLKVIPVSPVLLAPRGELAAGAMGLKAWKKRVFLKLGRLLGLFRGVHWQASSEAEAEEIQASGLVEEGQIHVARNLRMIPPLLGEEERAESAGNTPLRLVFVSRIAPIKQLDGALRILRKVKIPVHFDIHGPIDCNRKHWKECQRLMASLPEHVEACWHGPARPDRIPGIFSVADGFLFPTLGENFGHVIAEALLAGCPVLTSDQTPWSSLDEAGCGVNLPPDDIEGFACAVERLAESDPKERLAMRERARTRGIEGLGIEKAVEAHRKMFAAVIGDARIQRNGP